jgi:hypothetical protein
MLYVKHKLQSNSISQKEEALIKQEVVTKQKVEEYETAQNAFNEFANRIERERGTDKK